MHYRPAPLSAYVILFLTCMVLLVSSMSCSRNQRNDTIRASLTALNTARDGMGIWERKHLHEIVDRATTREEGEEAIAAYLVRRKPIVDAFEVAYRALAVAATQADDPSLKSALAASTELIDSVKKLIGGS